MKKSGLLNAELAGAVTDLRDTDLVVLCDSGFPAPKGVREIDISLVKFIPTLEQTLRAVVGELNVSKCYYVDYIDEWNPELFELLPKLLYKQEVIGVSDTEFSKLAAQAKLIIRTGEAKVGSNIILQSASGAEGYGTDMSVEC